MDQRVILLLVLEGCLAFCLLRLSGCVRSAKGLIRSALLIGFALFIRACFFDQENTDYQWFLKVWVDHYRTHGGFAGLAQSIGNYNIPYLYFLALFSYSSIRDLYLIKLLSIFFDIVLAFSGAMLVKKCSRSTERGAVCFFLLLYLPTVFLNSAYWGQCDSIYVSLALLGLALALPGETEKSYPALSMICIAASFGFKLQAVFLMPMWIVLWVWRKYKWYLFLLFPLTYLLLILPSVFAGRPLLDAVMLYADQANTVGTALNYNSPSLTALLRTTDTETVSRILIIAAFAAMTAIMLCGILLRARLSSVRFLYLSVLMAMAIPFLLPHMHDRYFYAADALTCVLACCVLPMISAAVFMQFGSLICYLAYFTGYYLRLGRTNIFLTNDKGAIAVFFAMALTLCGFVYSFSSKDPPPEN